MSEEELTFDEWYDLYENEINIELAENGADREMDFDPELEFEKRYQKYMEEVDTDIAGKTVQKQYIIERMEKYLMRFDIHDLLDLYVEIKTKSIEMGEGDKRRSYLLNNGWWACHTPNTWFKKEEGYLGGFVPNIQDGISLEEAYTICINLK